MKLKYFPLDTDELKIQGTPITEWSLRAGGTPFYIYDRQIILKKIREIREVLPQKMFLHYAIKANPMYELVQFISQHADGFDVASGGELNLALQTGMNPLNIGFAGPGKSDKELKLAILSNVLISIESMSEMDRIGALAQDLKRHPRLAFRINPEFEIKSSGMKMGGGPKQFGIDSELIPAAFERLYELGLSLEGIHIYAGSQILNAETLSEAQRQSFELLFSLKKYFRHPLKTFNLGGGFGIPYFQGETDLDLSKVRDNLVPLLNQLEVELPGTKPILELGRFLVGECGVFVSRIVDKKISRQTTYLVLDGGMNHHLAATGNLGQTIKRHFPIFVANRLQEPSKETVNIVGPLCTPLDNFATQVKVSTCKAGDLIAIFQSGAYGLSASPIRFLSHDLPKEIFV